MTFHSACMSFRLIPLPVILITHFYREDSELRFHGNQNILENSQYLAVLDFYQAHKSAGNHEAYFTKMPKHAAAMKGKVLALELWMESSEVYSYKPLSLCYVNHSLSRPLPLVRELSKAHPCPRSASPRVAMLRKRMMKSAPNVPMVCSISNRKLKDNSNKIQFLHLLNRHFNASFLVPILKNPLRSRLFWRISQLTRSPAASKSVGLTTTHPPRRR